MSVCIHAAEMLKDGELPPGWEREDDDGIEEFYTGCECCGMWMHLQAHGIIDHDSGATFCDSCAPGAASRTEGEK